MISKILSRPFLAVSIVLTIALGVVYWMFQEQIDRRVALAMEAGQVTQALTQLEAQQRQLVANMAEREELRARIEKLERRRRDELEGIHAELQQLRQQSDAVERWAAQPVPDALRLRESADGGDNPAAAGVSGADRHPAVPGTSVSGPDERRTVGDGESVQSDAHDLQRRTARGKDDRAPTGTGGNQKGE